MTVSTTDNRGSYAGNGVTTVFSFPNAFLADADLVVLDVLDSTGAETVKTLTTHYTVSGAGDAAGGSVTMLTAPAAGHTLVIYRDPALTQPIDLVNGDLLNVETGVERGFDRAAMQIQRVRDIVDRSLHLPEGDVGFTAADLELPAEVDRASKFLAFDADGKPIATAGIAGTVVVSPFMETVVDDTNQDAALVTLLSGADGNAALTNLEATRSETGATAVPVLTKLRECISVFDFMTAAQIADAVARTASLDTTAAIQAALTAANTITGGTVFIPAGTYKVTGALTLYKNTVLKGAGKAASILLSNHTGDGINSTWPINSSTPVNIVVEHLQLKNTNAANTGGGFVDVGGTYWSLRDCHIEGFKYGGILDQSELVEIDTSTFQFQLLCAVWLVNGDQHTVGASNLYTNRISIKRTQINNNATAGLYGIIDEGGYAHTFEALNFNGCDTHVYLAGVAPVLFVSCEWEGAATRNVLSEAVRYHGGGAVGSSVGVIFQSNLFVPDAGATDSLNFNYGGPLNLVGNYWSGAHSPKIAGVANIAHVVSLGNQYDAGALFTQSAYYQHVTMDWLVGGTGSGLTIGTNTNGIKKYLYATATWDPASIANTASDNVSVSCPGAEVGDLCLAGFNSIAGSGWTIDAQCVTADNVLVRITNLTGGAVDLASGTVKVCVFKS
jgi:hypothetical protein